MVFYERFEVFMAMKIQVKVLWVVAPRSDCGRTREFRGTFLPPSSGWSGVGSYTSVPVIMKVIP
jgi:hypothetical protein